MVSARGVKDALAIVNEAEWVLAVYPGARGKGSRAGKPKTVREGKMPNVFDVLSRDCGEVKQVLAGLETGPAAATGTDDNAAERLGVAAEPVINAMVLDVGEALVDETRECGTWAD